MSILRDPLAHFLLGGILIYGLLSIFEDTADPEQIVVNRAALLEHIQYRSKTFDEAFAQKKLQAMSPAAIRDLVEQISTEEALYREARTLGLEQGDYVIRQRLVGKIKYLTDTGGDIGTPEPAALEAFYNENIEDYRVPATATLTHIFVSASGKTEASLASEAKALLGRIAGENPDRELTTALGDRFLFTTNYVDRDERFISKELGVTAATEILSDSSPVKAWFGPVMSNYGAHLIYIFERDAVQTPVFETVRSRVTQDYAAKAQRDLQAAMERRIVESYKIKTTPDVEALMGGNP